MYYEFELIAMNFTHLVGYLLVGALLSVQKITNYLENIFSLGYLLFGPVSVVIIFITVLFFRKYVYADPLRKTQKVL